jgi:hypothetical protein
MPASFGFPWCLVYFGIDSGCPILKSILYQGIKSPYNELPGSGNYGTSIFGRMLSSFGGCAGPKIVEQLH